MSNRKRLGFEELNELLAKIKSDYSLNIVPDYVFHLPINLDEIASLSLFFRNCLFEKEVIVSAKCESQLSFDNCVFEDAINIDKAEINGIYFRESRWPKNPVQYSKIKTLFYEKCDFVRSDIVNSTQIGRLFLKENESGIITFEGKELGQINFENNKNLFHFFLEKDRIEFLAVNEVTIKQNGSFSGSYNFAYISIGDLNIEGRIDKALIQFSLCFFGDITIEKLINTGNISVANCLFKENTTLYISKSDLGKMTLLDLDFKGTKIDFRSSNLKDVIYSGINWCSNSSLTERMYKDKKVVYDYFYQLRLLHTNQQNKPEELKAYSKEMYYYYKLLKSTPGNKSDKFILWINDITNSFGQDWLTPIFQILLVNIIFYFSTQLCLDSKYNVEYLPQNIAGIVELCNPIHKFSETYNVKVEALTLKGSIGYILDAFNKIVVSFLIFQSIRGFRKYKQ